MKAYVTNKGQELINRAIAGSKLTITRAELGDGTPPGASSIRAQTALTHKAADAALNGIRTSGNNRTIVSVQYDNAGLSEGFSVTEAAVYAKIGSGTEKLLLYVTFEENPDYIAPATDSAYIRTYDFVLSVSSDTEIVVSAVPSYNAYIDEKAAALDVRLTAAEKKLGMSFTAAIPHTGWNTQTAGGETYYTRNVTVSGLLSTDQPIIDLNRSGDWAADQALRDAWDCVARIAATAANTLTVMADAVPSVDIPIKGRCLRDG